MSILDRFKSNRVSKEDKSKQLILKIDKRIEEAGVSDARARMVCSEAIMKATVKQFRSLQKVARGKGNVDGLVQVWTDGLKTSLLTAGVTDVAVQEDTILDFVDIMADVMEGKNG